MKATGRNFVLTIRGEPVIDPIWEQVVGIHWQMMMEGYPRMVWWTILDTYTPIEEEQS